MTEDQIPPTHDCGGDSAAYALGALDAGEVEAFRAHLESCIVCRDELAAFEQVVDVLPMSAAQHRAPRSLRRNVMRAAHHEEPSPACQVARARSRSRCRGRLCRVQRPPWGWRWW